MGHQKDPKETQSAALQQKGHLPNSYRNNAQNRGTAPRSKVGNPMKSTRRKEREIPRRKEAKKSLKPHQGGPPQPRGGGAHQEIKTRSWGWGEVAFPPPQDFGSGREA